MNKVRVLETVFRTNAVCTEFPATTVIKRQMCHFYSEKRAEKASWQPFWIPNFCQSFPYGMSLFLAILVPNMKTMHICIGSGCYKHGRILLKFGMQVSIWHGIIENEIWSLENPKKISQFLFCFYNIFQDF